jgi:hypothetical protein
LHFGKASSRLQRMAPIRPSCRNVHGAASVNAGSNLMGRNRPSGVPASVK